MVHDAQALWRAKDALAYTDTLYNLARHLTGDDADAEDLVQETFTRALVARDSFHGGNLKAWLFRILRNVFIDQYRRRRNNPVDSVESELGAIGTPALDELEAGQVRGLVRGDIEAALLALPAAARQIILLDLEGLSEVEVADVLDCAVGTVKSRLARARAALRRRLADYAREGSP